MMTNTFTAIYQQEEGIFVGWVEELPGANTQGSTLEETRGNLKEAVALILAANRQLAEEEIAGKLVLKEEIQVSA